MNTHAQGDDTSALLQTARQGATAEARLFALKKLRERRVPRLAAALAPRLYTLHVGDPEAEVLLSLFAQSAEGDAQHATARWLKGEFGERAGRPLGPLSEAWKSPAGERTLRSAAQVLARSAGGEEVDLVLASLVTHPDGELARLAATALAEPTHGTAGRLECWRELLFRLEPGLGRLAVPLLGRSQDPAAIELLIAAAEREKEANPRQAGSPEHGQALRQLTGASLGNEPAEWRAWYEAQKRPLR